MEKRGLRGAEGAKKRRQGRLPHGSLTTYRTSVTARDVSGVRLLSTVCRLSASLPGVSGRGQLLKRAPRPVPALPSELPLQGLLPAGSPL